MAEAYLSEHVTSEEWRGDYLGIRWSVRRWEHPDSESPFNPTWNFYLWVSEQQVPEGCWPAYWLEPERVDEMGRVFYPDQGTLLGELEWHGGMTYYEKHGLDGGAQRVEAGCDYAHLWNVERGVSTITFEEVLYDLQRCIESLREREPGLLWRCRYNGRYYEEGEGEVEASGTFLSHEGAEEIAKWRDKEADK